LFIWGAQLEVASSVSNYTPTPANFSTAPSLLLNFANAAVIDSAGAQNFTTVSGATITNSSKYGSGALTFNGSSDYLLAPAMGSNGFGLNNFTIEHWVNWTVVGNGNFVTASPGNVTGAYYWQYYSGQLQFGVCNTGPVVTYTWAPATNTWYHLCVMRQGTSYYLYINGQQIQAASYSQTWVDAATYVGYGGAGYLNGKMDDIRITNGVVRYNIAGFTPPARALPEVGGKSFTTVNINAGVVKSFTTTGTTSWTAPTDVSQVEVLVVAGGGGGGHGSSSGGGGGGGVIYNTQYPVTPGQTYTVTVGAGGAGTSGSVGGSGGNSIFGNLTAIGGGGAGAAGGSGGGAPNSSTYAGTAGQGFAGGQGYVDGSAYYRDGGGGGAGGVGGNSSTNSGSAGNGGAGGVGLQFGISGTPTYYAGGGGGAGWTRAGPPHVTPGTGGLGGGGAGSLYNIDTPTAGTANTGGGGGASNNGAAGGSGIVLIRYTTAAVGNTSDATTDNLVDSPTLYGHDTGAGGEVVGNYATMNPLMGSTLPTFSNGNLTITGNSGSSSFGCVYSSIAMTSGNWYAEVRLDVLGTNQTQLGVASYVYPRDSSNQNGLNSGLVLINFDNSLSAYRGVYQNGSVLTGGNVGMTFSVGDIIGVAFNATARTVAFYQNGVSLGSSSPYSVADVGTGQFYFVGLVGNTASTKLSWNFGQRAWAYTPPAGFNALTTKNLPRLTNAAAIAPNQYFSAVLYTGNGTNSPNALTISSLNFQPDLVWIKNRTSATDNWLQDTVRGLGYALNSNTTSIDLVTGGGDVSAVNSTGFVVSYANSRTNASANNYVAWCWRAGGTAVSNTAGTITSQVSVNTASGFSIVTYTGGATGATVGHGLGVTPAFVITKCRNATQYWIVHHQSIAITSNLYLQTTDGAQPDSQYTAKSATTLTLGSNVNSVNTTGNTYVSYCWAEVAGFSKFGSYDGNSSTDGPFVYCGFKPALVMIKGNFSAAASQWYVYDNGRDTFNPVASRMLLNTSGTETLATDIDFVSNGFKLRYPAGGGGLNSTGSTYIYAAFAEKPFGNANGTAR
jgi:hypothetical protein